MTTTAHISSPNRRRVPTPDLVGGLLLLVLMSGALVMTRGWDEEAALFPRAVSLAGAVLGLVLVVLSLIGTREAAPGLHDRDAADAQLEYIFHTASPRLWLVTMGWFGGFFVSLYVLGLYATAILYTVAYLRTQDQRSWLFTGTYAVILAGVLYLAFTVVLGQSVPPGFFGLS